MPCEMLGAQCPHASFATFVQLMNAKHIIEAFIRA